MFDLNFWKKTLTLLSGLTLALPALAHETIRAVYAMDNAASGNRIVVYSRDSDGRLKPDGSFPTGGFGTGAGLGSQGAITLSGHKRWLLAVSAGSNELSVFAVRASGLTLTDIVPSGGKKPISVTIDKNLVYVLNAGGAADDKDNITGFYLTEEGRLIAIPDSTRSLSAANTGPAQVSFTSSGNFLIVTEKTANVIGVFPVLDDGKTGSPIFTPAKGNEPFGFAVAAHDRFIVSEAATGSVSSYQVLKSGQLDLVTGALPLSQKAPCWVVLTRDGRFAYTTNTASNTISGLRVAPSNGSLELLSPDGLTGQTGNAPTDAGISDDQRFLYALNSKDGSIGGFQIEPNGKLSPVGTVGSLPPGATGLAAR